MGKCVNHPETEPSYKCMKHNIYLCDQCLECRDPELYCKYRSSCPIWFLSKGTRKLDESGESPAQEAACRVDFAPDGKSAEVPADATLLDAAGKADVYINASCNGKGACGKCKLIVEDGEVEKTDTALLSDKEKQKGYVLACQSRVRGQVSVRVPEETIERKLRVAGMGEEITRRLQGRVTEISPMLEKISMELSPPSLDDPVSDLDRLKRGLKKNGIDTGRTNIGLPVMRQLAAAMRNKNWNVTTSIMHKTCSSEVVAVEPGNGAHTGLGLAISLNIVQKMGGDISFDSRPGLTEFRVVVPRTGSDTQE
jgi:ferredoxin